MANKIPSLDLWYEPDTFQNSTKYEQMNHNWSVLMQYGASLSDYVLSIIKGYDDRFNQQLQQAPQPSEILDARLDSWNVKWPTLKARLDNDEQSTPRLMHDSYSDAMFILQLRDLTTSSDKFSYTKIQDLAKMSIPAMGYTNTSINGLSTEVVG
ncbi:alpha-amylase [Ligilactobacillus acidipiscis]|uniref:alpha-amylase n=2 Tax=Ligilactobacillus acidipiscis TaxID=89059 RepID=UPI0022E7B204|nr:alpha-amylase [Ligilactobacillus acidipiscis]